MLKHKSSSQERDKEKTRSRDLEGPLRSISKFEKVKENYKNKVITITSVCLCVRDSLVMRLVHTMFGSL